MRVHRRQLLCRCHTCFPLGRSRAKPEQSCCSFPPIRSIFRSRSDKADIHNRCAMTFNHGVEGSSPSALTNKILSSISADRQKGLCRHCVGKRVTCPERVMSDELDWNFVDKDDA